MRFSILGSVEVWAGDRRLVLGGPRQLGLLSFLLLHRNRAVSRDSLMDALWGEDAGIGDKRLQMAIARLRKELEPPGGGGERRLRTVIGGYLLAVEPGELDADVFADLVRDGRAALQAGDPARASELLVEALALWRGPPLAEVSFAEFAQAEIRQLEELRLQALESRFDADLALGKHSELVAELEALVVEHPTRERAAGQLMLALYRSGRQSEALGVYQRVRSELLEQLGLEPGPDLRSLQAQILEQTPTLNLDTSVSAPIRARLRAPSRCCSPTSRVLRGWRPSLACPGPRCSNGITRCSVPRSMIRADSFKATEGDGLFATFTDAQRCRAGGGGGDAGPARAYLARGGRRAEGADGVARRAGAAHARGLRGLEIHRAARVATPRTAANCW